MFDKISHIDFNDNVPVLQMYSLESIMGQVPPNIGRETHIVFLKTVAKYVYTMYNTLLRNYLE